MSAKITITWPVSMGYSPGDYARLYSNNGSGDIDYEKPLTNNKFDLFPQGGGIYGFGQHPFGKSSFGLSNATRVSGFGQIPFGRGPFGLGTTIIQHEHIVDFCGEYKFAFKLFDKFGNENGGTLEEISVAVHIAPPQPTSLKKGTYLNHCQITGQSDPDVTGLYAEDGIYNGYMSYKRQDGQYYIWFCSSMPMEIMPPAYVITTVKGSDEQILFASGGMWKLFGETFANFASTSTGNPVAADAGKILTLEAA